MKISIIEKTKSLLAILFILLMGTTSVADTPRLSRDMNVDLLVNQAGYLPDASKKCIVQGVRRQNFDIIHVVSNKVVFTGQFQPRSGDFGDYSAGDFSEVSEEGVYYVISDTLRSFPFEISDKVYEPAMSLIVNYFSRQRCGASTTGYLTPCHLDDGLRMDNGKHQDVSGGWHDANDLRKWVGATIYGMIGLAKVYEIYPKLDKQKLMDELRWGNRYFLNMQESEGYVMSYVGGDVLKHSDSNRWTDNISGKAEGKLGFTRPNTGRSTAEMLIFGANDDRVIKTDPVDFFGQFNFITAEAIMARITKENDLEYADRCLKAAEKCFSWCKASDITFSPGIIGASIQAAIELYKTTNNEVYAVFAANQANRLKKFQCLDDQNKFRGFFYSSTERDEPYRNIWNGCMEFYALCDLVELLPAHKDGTAWKNMISCYVENYLKAVMKRNIYNIVPHGIYAESDPGGNRIIEDYWYRYFMQPELQWWVGINSNLASTGIGLLKAARLLKDIEIRSYAQRQLDWILGSNPFNSSTLIGIGTNHPKHFPGSTFYPLTPVLQGAVMNGLGGNHDDQPDFGNGDWQISEYWTPMVAHTLWLMAELSAAY